MLQHADGREEVLSGHEDSTTNNRMEMLAAISALEALSEKYAVDVYTDSEYLRGGITTWIHNWQRNGWKTASKQEVKNKDLWLRLLDAAEKHEITWHWVKGHSGQRENEIVDQYARSRCAG